MTELPSPLEAFNSFKQFILWKPVPRDGKVAKLPVDYRTGKVHSAHDPEIHMTAQEAIAHAVAPYGVGFVFTDHDPFFFLDIDNCLQPDNTWSPLALGLLAALPGACAEVSQSGKGLHVFGVGSLPQGHVCKNIALGIELYTSQRFVALTGSNALGDAATDCTQALTALTAQYFPVAEGRTSSEWSDEPEDGWRGFLKDEDLIKAACDSQSARAAFGLACSFKQLWEADVDALASAYPGDEVRMYDSSSVDASLAQHLAFWTGNDCERILSLMQQSALVRDKWDREDYLERTILHATSLCTRFHTTGDAPVVDEIALANDAVTLKATSDKQRLWAESVRANKLQESIGNAELTTALCAVTDAKIFIDHRGNSAEEIIAWSKPAGAPTSAVTVPTLREAGLQYLSADMQLEHFKGCVYVQSSHKIFTPNEGMLNPDRFNATYGGYEFQMSDGGKSKEKAWVAFTESQLVDYPHANDTCFRPELPTGTLVREEGWVLVNTYVPVDTPRQSGDITPFLAHVEKMLPAESDRNIIYAYMASMLQHKGVKFQWCPLIQGMEGNGKTMLSWCMSFALGHRYTHLPMPHELAEKFNSWLFNKLFIGIEDVYVPESKREVLEILKPMITNNRLAMRAMNQGQVMGDNRANFILNSNHKDAIRKTRNDRRFAVFYTAQQNEGDLERDQMGGSYFPDLYKWLREGGYAAVSEWLHTYAIPDALNPATSCHRAPVTTSTNEAISASLGSVEHEILEAIAEGRRGFAGGWVSSAAVEVLLKDMRLDRAVPRNRRRALLQSLGYDHHPSLVSGRVNNPTLTDGRKTCLFIPIGHVNGGFETPTSVTQAYDNAQAGLPVPVVGSGGTSHG